MIMKSALLAFSATAFGMLAIVLGAAPAAQSPAAQAPSVNLTGTWTGTGRDTYLGIPDGVKVTWVLTQTGSTVSGTVQTLPLDPSHDCVSCHRTRTGTVSGTVAGTALTLTMDFPNLGQGATPTPTNQTPQCAVALNGFAATIANNAFTTVYSGTDQCEQPIQNGTLDMTLQAAPSITSQPASQTIAPGQTASFSLVASGTAPLGYQWQVSTNGGTTWTNLTDTAPYSGSATATLTITSVTPSLTASQYRAVATNSVGTATSTAATLLVRAMVVDADGDGKADLVIFRPSTGTWFVDHSATGYTTNTSRQWGISTDVPVPGDYDGDGLMDLAVYRPATGVWYVLNSSTNFATSLALSWGISTDIPVPGDYDGDGKTDPAVYRPSTGTWYILQSSTNYTTSMSFSWGISTDVPVRGDYDGDGKADPAVYRPSTGAWYALKSSTNYTTSLAVAWGISTDTPVNKSP